MQPSIPIRLVLVDEQTVIRRGVTAIVAASPDIQIIEECTNGEQALQYCIHHEIDVVLTEIKVSRMNGVTMARAIRKRCPSTKIVFFTDVLEGTAIKDAFAAGATAYLLKKASAEELIHTIRTAAQGRTILGPEVSHCLLQNKPTLRSQIGSDLTVREREVLALMVTGMSNRAIAQTLTVSLSTVKFHVSNILAKLQLKARAEAISIAMRHNLVRE